MILNQIRNFNAIVNNTFLTLSMELAIALHKHNRNPKLKFLEPREVREELEKMQKSGNGTPDYVPIARYDGDLLLFKIMDGQFIRFWINCGANYRLDGTMCSLEISKLKELSCIKDCLKAIEVIGYEAKLWKKREKKAAQKRAKLTKSNKSN